MQADNEPVITTPALAVVNDQEGAVNTANNQPVQVMEEENLLFTKPCLAHIKAKRGTACSISCPMFLAEGKAVSIQPNWFTEMWSKHGIRMINKDIKKRRGETNPWCSREVMRSRITNFRGDIDVNPMVAELTGEEQVK